MGINRKAATLIASAAGVLAIGGGVTAAALSAGGGSHPAGSTQSGVTVQNVDYATEPASSSAAPATLPVASASASRSTSTAAVVSPSKKRAAQQKVAVQDQGDPVTDPTTTQPADPPPTSDPATDEGQPRPAPGDDGVVRKPRPTRGPTNPNRDEPIVNPSPSESS